MCRNSVCSLFSAIVLIACTWPLAGMNKRPTYILRNKGIRCVTFPCFTWELIKDGSAIKSRISDIDVTSLHLGDRQKAALLRALERTETCVRGFTTSGPDGPGGVGLTFHVSRVIGSPANTAKDRRAPFRCSQN